MTAGLSLTLYLVLRPHASRLSTEMPLPFGFKSVHAGGGGGFLPLSWDSSSLTINFFTNIGGVLVGGRVDLLGTWGTQTRAYSVGERAWNRGPTSQTPLDASHGPIFVS